jgi:hypothetical protein
MTMKDFAQIQRKYSLSGNIVMSKDRRLKTNIDI